MSALTSLRFFGALTVMIFHYGVIHRFLSADMASMGYEALAFFFILSGFVLTYAYADALSGSAAPKLRAREFILFRLSRIVPVYLLALIIAAPFFVHRALAGTHNTPLFLAAATITLMVQAWYPAAVLLWNPPAWSLSNEVFFYTIYSTILRIMRRLPVRAVLLAPFVAILFINLLRDMVPVPPQSQAWHNFWAYFPLLNLPQFILGVAIGLLYKSRPMRSPLGYDRMLLMSVTLLAFIICFRSRIPWIGNATILSMLFASVIFAAAGAEGRLVKILAIKPLVILGNASYAMYILHAPLWFCWDRINNVYLHTRLPPIADFSLYATAVICVSVLVLNFIERPARRWIMKKSAAFQSGYNPNVSPATSAGDRVYKMIEPRAAGRIQS